MVTGTENSNDGAHRRDVLNWMAASAALAGLSGCTKMPEQKIVPYVRPPEEVIPGSPLFYATSTTMGGVGGGNFGRKQHGPADESRRQSAASGQFGRDGYFRTGFRAGLYDPDRSQTVIHEGRISSLGHIRFPSE